MNFTTGNTPANLGKRINWHVVSLAGGLALALSVMAGPGVIERDPTQTPAAAVGNVSEPPTASTASRTSTRPQVIIVESQVQADALQAAMAADQMATVMQGYEVPHRQILVVSTPEEGRELYEVLMEQLLLTEQAIEIVDLRN
jgi:hypothetical protein